MRSDLFLSHLLFGITVLTCFLAIGQLLSALLLAKIRAKGRVRAGIRSLLLSLSVLVGIGLFISKVPGLRRDLLNTGSGANGVLPAPRSVSNGDLGEIARASFSESENDNSWTV